MANTIFTNKDFNCETRNEAPDYLEGEFEYVCNDKWIIATVRTDGTAFGAEDWEIFKEYYCGEDTTIKSVLDFCERIAQQRARFSINYETKTASIINFYWTNEVWEGHICKDGKIHTMKRVG